MMKAFLIDQTSNRNCYFNLAFEEALCLNFTKHNYLGGLRFWWNENSIIAGISDPLSKNIPEETILSFKENLQEIKQTKSKVIPFPLSIARRASGGGTVYQERDWNLNYSIFINLKEKKELYPINDSYSILSKIVISALQKVGINALQAGKSDLSIQGAENLLKISGNAQFRKKDCLVHHGTLILKQELIDKVKTTLKHPPLEPDYRKGRSHEKFITTLPENFALPVFKKSLEIKLEEYLGLQLKSPELSYLKNSFRLTFPLIQEKYLNSEFIFSRE
jgi:lipoate---protein ligase